jgi:hypothetical protein
MPSRSVVANHERNCFFFSHTILEGKRTREQNSGDNSSIFEWGTITSTILLIYFEHSDVHQFVVGYCIALPLSDGYAERDSQHILKAQLYDLNLGY